MNPVNSSRCCGIGCFVISEVRCNSNLDGHFLGGLFSVLVEFGPKNLRAEDEAKLLANVFNLWGASFWRSSRSRSLTTSPHQERFLCLFNLAFPTK